jgi:hypothetical protein
VHRHRQTRSKRSRELRGRFVSPTWRRITSTLRRSPTVSVTSSVCGPSTAPIRQAPLDGGDSLHTAGRTVPAAENAPHRAWRSYAYVPGVELDGTFALAVPSLDVTVGGRHAAAGTVTMTPDGRIHARLGGETIDVQRGTSAVGRALPRARPALR